MLTDWLLEFSLKKTLMYTVTLLSSVQQPLAAKQPESARGFSLPKWKLKQQLIWQKKYMKFSLV